jgi:hypothetical protein
MRGFLLFRHIIRVGVKVVKMVNFEAPRTANAQTSKVVKVEKSIVHYMCRGDTPADPLGGSPQEIPPRDPPMGFPGGSPGGSALGDPLGVPLVETLRLGSRGKPDHSHDIAVRM